MERIFIYKFLIYLLMIGFSEQRSTPEDDHYVAAVIEYELRMNTTLNLENYLQFIQDAANQGVDIVIFPESSLSSDNIKIPFNSTLKEFPVPALRPDLYDEILISISEAARQNEVYVVINIGEVMDCTGDGSSAPEETCPEPIVYLFNTNVVFDRQGAVIDRYRKINLFIEPQRTPALTPDLGIFESDFGVTFAHFICFDLMYQAPALQVLRQNIVDVISTTMWFSEMPFVTAVQIQQSYAYSMNVNFLVAGASNVGMGSAGSGIYSGKSGSLVSIMPGMPTTKLLVARVPKVPGQVAADKPGPIYFDPSDQHSLTITQDVSLDSHVTRFIRTGSEEFTLLDKDVICHFKVRFSPSDLETRYRYRASAFSGVRAYPLVGTGGIRTCAIFACTSSSIDTCGKRFDTFTPNATGTFEELSITAMVPIPKTNDELGVKDSVYFPVSLNTAIMPLEPEDFTYEVQTIFDTLDIHTYRIKGAKSDLYSFAIWGREFSTDHEEPTSSRPDIEENEDGTTVPPSTESDPSDPNVSVTHRINGFVLLLCFSMFFI